MERHKIERFEIAHPGRTFPQYTTIATDEARRLFCKLTFLTDYSETDNVRGFLRHLIGLSVPVTGIDAREEGFDLGATMKGLKIRPSLNVFINWDTFKTIDYLMFSDLSASFQDIWYESSDDIEIFDDSCSWVLFVQHFGALSIVRLPTIKGVGTGGA
jgi:hypothetical protein